MLSNPVFVLMAVAIIAGVPRFDHLSYPPDRVFDEVYYTKDGCLYAGFPYRQCDLSSDFEQSWVHPPFGKWMIAAGIRLFGNHPFGWRVAAATVGTLTVVLIAGIALLLWRSPWWAFLAGLLGATESLLVVQSRTALLDIFEAFWVAAAFLFLLLDKRWIERRTPAAPVAEVVPPPEVAVPSEPAELSTGPGAMASSEELEPPAAEPSTPRVRVPSPFWRPWRVATGVAFGLATAVKWSALAALAGAMVLAWAWERTRRKTAGVARPLRGAIARESFPILVCLLVLPGIVYCLTYMGRMDSGDSPRYHPGLSYSWVAHPGRLVRLTHQMEQFHTGLKAYSKDKNGKLTPAHPYESKPWTWLAMGRPVAYFYKAAHGGTPEERRREILGIGNPMIFWLGFVTIPWLAVMWRRRRDFRAGLLFVAFASQYLFWFWPTWPLYSLPKVQFFFYMTPLAPFLVLGTTYVVRDLARMRLAGSTSRPFLPVAAGIVVVAVGMFVFFWPVLAGRPLSVDAWQARMWFPSWI